MAASELIHVPPDADDDAMEKLRQQLEAALNAVNRHAYTRVGHPDEGLNG
jgi:hypothetical protein